MPAHGLTCSVRGDCALMLTVLSGCLSKFWITQAMPLSEKEGWSEPVEKGLFSNIQLESHAQLNPQATAFSLILLNTLAPHSALHLSLKS
jgi:hypothetical protein